MSNINKLKLIWENVYNPTIDTKDTIIKYFHPEYVQCINGIDMEREKYIDHVIVQKQNMVIHHIEYTHYLEADNNLFAIYYPSGIDKDNLPIKAEVIVYVVFKDDQIYKMHGQVRLIQGDLKSVDMDN